MKLPPGLRKLLMDCIQNAFTEFAFQELTNNYMIGVSYQDTRLPFASYPENIGNYLDEVQRRGYVRKLIEAIKQERSENDLVIILNKQYQNYFANDTNETKLKWEIFFREVIINGSRLFIAREPFSAQLARMINRDAVSLLGLKGQSKTGLSYVRYYLGEMEEELSCYRLINLNLAQIGELYPDETITSAHLAEIITSELKMQFTSLKDFKLAPFLISLRLRLDELAKAEEKCLFFIDQFDYPHTKDIKTLVKVLARMVLERSNVFYLVFSTYENWDVEWDSEQVESTELIEFSSFSKEDIDAFLNKLYNNNVIDFKSKISKATFLATAHNSIREEMYSIEKGPNVPIISRELRIWFRQLKKNLNI